MWATIPSFGCKSLPPSQTATEASAKQPNSTTNQAERVFYHVPKPSQHFRIWQKLNPVWWVRNADDPVPPESYRAGECCRNFTWYVRNPCHNFTFYVMGIADKPFTRMGRYPAKTSNPNGGWNWAVCKYKWLRLPFIDYRRGRFEFYLGWRTGGNFGVKLNFAQKKRQAPPTGTTEK